MFLARSRHFAELFPDLAEAGQVWPTSSRQGYEQHPRKHFTAISQLAPQRPVLQTPIGKVMFGCFVAPSATRSCSVLFEQLVESQYWTASDGLQQAQFES